jgi:hypothetical protein
MANVKPKDFECRICGEHLHSKQELDQHNRENHAGQQASDSDSSSDTQGSRQQWFDRSDRRTDRLE